MWQDGLALLVVVIAALALLRLYLPAGWFRFGVRRGGDGSAASSAAPTGCSGCGSETSCAKVQIKVYPVAAGRGKRLPSDPC